MPADPEIEVVSVTPDPYGDQDDYDPPDKASKSAEVEPSNHRKHSMTESLT